MFNMGMRGIFTGWENTSPGRKRITLKENKQLQLHCLENTIHQKQRLAFLYGSGVLLQAVKLNFTELVLSFISRFIYLFIYLLGKSYLPVCVDAVESLSRR